MIAPRGRIEYPLFPMEVFETQSRDEAIRKFAELEAAGHQTIRSYLYWYEGAGVRRLKKLPGPAAQKFWDTLDLTQKLKVAFSFMSAGASDPEIRDLSSRYRQELNKDFATFGGYTEVDGLPEDATFVIEYE